MVGLHYPCNAHPADNNRQRDTTMLKSWSIQNFKPILDSGELKLAPVTVLAGRNSSGKSSLIQSILMIAQTLSNRVLDRALLPNGPIVQLGTFEDILSEQTDLRALVVGFTLEIEKEEPRTLAGARAKRSNFSRRGVESVKITAQFRSATSNGMSTSAIEASRVNVESVELDVQPSSLPLFQQSDFSMFIKRLSPVELEKFLEHVLSEDLNLVPYATDGSNYLGKFTPKSKSANAHVPELSLIAFSHFLPTRLIGKYLVEERRKSRVTQILEMMRWHADTEVVSNRLSEFLQPSTTFLDDSREAIVDLCKRAGISNTFSGQSLNDLLQWSNSLQFQLDEGQELYFYDNLEDIIIPGVLKQLQPLEKGTETLEAVASGLYIGSLTEAVEQTTQFFTSKIRYLGPLRADPQASQKFSPSSELDDVGAKGEYAAAVYDANHNEIIQWYNPTAEKTEKGPLKVALTTWVRYLGVANEIKSQDAGQSGVNWQVVNRKDRKALPLSAVGVGVSQILPILVMGLLAPSNTLLIVEQPELHLHPSVQARLGDFFMGLAKCSKQCLIETHSENLVSQLRLHIVEAGGQENADCLIYFVDQDERGAAQFNPIEISPKGNILNWPDGFFDETMLQEDRITAAGLKKRAKKANDG